jgi:hypothetical protein
MLLANCRTGGGGAATALLGGGFRMMIQDDNIPPFGAPLGPPGTHEERAAAFRTRQNLENSGGMVYIVFEPYWLGDEWMTQYVVGAFSSLAEAKAFVEGKAEEGYWTWNERHYEEPAHWSYSRWQVQPAKLD